MESLESIEKTKGKKPLVYLLIPVVILVVILLLLVKLYERERPQLTLLSDITQIGLDETVSILLTDYKSGLRSVDVYLVQGQKSLKIFEKTFVKTGLLGNNGPERAEESFFVNSRKLSFKDGQARLEIKVRDYSWANLMKGNLTALTYDVVLDSMPPRVTIVNASRYIIPGGAGLITYKINEEVTQHGVRINDVFHPGFPLPDKVENVYGAFIAIPHDTEVLEKSQIEAFDQAGNLGVKPFSMILRKVSKKVDSINVDDAFLALKMPEFAQYYPELMGKTPIEQYVEVNNRIRRENGEKIIDVCGKSSPERFWEGRFLRMRGSSRRAGFAEYRTYYYNGKPVDKQVHLGIDLASTSQAAVEAANRGMVVFADYLGIYGNCVIIDHGQGLFSLYSHLSQIDVHDGDMVDKGQPIALSGATGMAGGDHLHFSMLVNGVFVNPLEWWDEQWLRLNVLNSL